MDWTVTLLVICLFSRLAARYSGSLPPTCIHHGSQWSWSLYIIVHIICILGTPMSTNLQNLSIYSVPVIKRCSAHKMVSRGSNFQQIQRHTLGYTDLILFSKSYLRKKISQSSWLDRILGIQGFAFSVLESDSLLMEHFSLITPLIIMQDVM